MFNFLAANLLSAEGVFALMVPIIIFANLIVIFLTVFLIIKLKNNLGIYICWIPSFISFLVIVIFLFSDISSALFVLFLFFLPYFISYALTTVLKIRSDKIKTEKKQREKAEQDKIKEELDKISIQDL